MSPDKFVGNTKCFEECFQSQVHKSMKCGNQLANT